MPGDLPGLHCVNTDTHTLRALLRSTLSLTHTHTQRHATSRPVPNLAEVFCFFWAQRKENRGRRIHVINRASRHFGLSPRRHGDCRGGRGGERGRALRACAGCHHCLRRGERRDNRRRRGWCEDHRDRGGGGGRRWRRRWRRRWQCRHSVAPRSQRVTRAGAAAAAIAREREGQPPLTLARRGKVGAVVEDLYGPEAAAGGARERERERNPQPPLTLERSPQPPLTLARRARPPSFHPPS